VISSETGPRKGGPEVSSETPNLLGNNTTKEHPRDTLRIARLVFASLGVR
jgi:hypothetical protein